MDFLGIGPLELLFILVILIVVVGPRDIKKTARALGRGLNTLYKSDLWRVLRFFGDELRSLPTRLAREAELDKLKDLPREVADATNPGLGAWTPAGAKQAPSSTDSAPPNPATPQPEPRSSPTPDSGPPEPQSPVNHQ